MKGMTDLDVEDDYTAHPKELETDIIKVVDSQADENDSRVFHNVSKLIWLF